LSPVEHLTIIEPSRTIRLEDTMNILRMLPLAVLLLPSLAARAEEPLTFERQVRPILKAYCLDCHGGGAKLEGKLDLRLKRTAGIGERAGRPWSRGSPTRASC